MQNRILIIGINYFPEDSAIGLYSTEKAEYLVSKGFDVTVITGFPYYPQWEIRDDYKSKPYLVKETINGVKVFRSKQYVPKDPTFIKRIIHLTSFTFGNFINLFRVNKPDIVISIVPFTTSALLGWFIKKRYKSKHWVHIQDFEFDAAIDSGLLTGNKKVVIDLLQSIEKFVLSKADIVSTISFGMIAKLKQKSKTNTFYLTNWIDTTKFSSNKIKSHRYLESNAFKILYSGNIGAKQDWGFFIEFLNHVKSIDNVEVIVVGEGAEKDSLLSKIKHHSIVKHYNLVPYEELPSLLSSADLHILFQKTDVIDTVMPSKILGMMASAKPSIVTGNLKSEVATVFKESQGGFYFDDTEMETIIQKIRILKNDKKHSQNIGLNAMDYVNRKFSKTEVLDNFIDKLESI